jgi:hypothetical protein
MRQHQYTVVVPGSGNGHQPTYVDVDATGTGLDGITAGTACALTLAADLATVGSLGGGDAVPTVRVSADNTLRFRIKGFGGTFAALVTELL